MSIFYDPKTGWFRHIGVITEDQVPEGSVQIDVSLFAELMTGESEGKVITAGANGIPFLQDPPPPAPPTVDEILNWRRVAYRDESDPLYMEWKFDGTAASERVWREKVEEIKERFPLP